MDIETMKAYIKSPLNYTGGKYKLLPQILPLLPEKIGTFVDLFGGGGVVSANVMANKIVYNDSIKELSDLLEHIYRTPTEESLSMIKGEIEKYELSKTNKEGYYKIREYYNKTNRSWYIFYTMICYSFNNQIRFNKNNCFNMPFGKNRSSFNSTLEQKFILFSNKIKEKNILFTSRDYRKINIESLRQDDFVYCDPPYLIACASYNEGSKWGETEERDLFNILDKLNSKNIKFALSNVLEHKGNKNELLIEWSKKYNVHFLNYNYNNCNYQSNNKKNKTVEVLITNY